MTYSTNQRQEILDEICKDLIEGISLRQIAKREHMPAISTLMEWLNGDEHFRNTIARARELQADVVFDDMTDLVNRMLSDDLDVQKVKTAIWAKQWQASKLKPKKYGDKQTTEITGKDGGAIQTENKLDLSGLNDEQLRAIASITVKSE